MKTLTRFALILPALFVPAVASAVNWGVGITIGLGGGSGGGYGSTCPDAICGVASTIINVINGVLVPLLFAVAFIVFLWGVAKSYILSRGDEEEVSKGHRLILWGVIGFAVMISLWGLVNVITTTFGLNTVTAPPPPKSY